MTGDSTSYSSPDPIIGSELQVVITFLLRSQRQSQRLGDGNTRDGRDGSNVSTDATACH